MKEWTDAVHYRGVVVAYQGATYQARCDTGRPPPGDEWILLAASARTPSPKGTFEPDAAYARLDIVALNGGSFIALRDNPGPCPGDGWQLLTRQGQRGIAGPRGERGERGPAGPAISIKGWKIDRARFAAAPVLSDGSEGASLDLRGLFEQYQDETS